MSGRVCALKGLWAVVDVDLEHGYWENNYRSLDGGRSAWEPGSGGVIPRAVSAGVE